MVRNMAGPAGTPTRAGPYRIERELGRGGMGIVYLAHDTRLDRTVALKSLPDEVAGDPDRLQRFEREARLLASLNHPHIAAIYDIVEEDGRRYLALEHVEGESLAQRLVAGPLPMDEAIGIALQIASGMEAAHEQGVVHRDLKPGNVMLTSADEVKIVDFGLARGRLATASGAGGRPGSPTSPIVSDEPLLSNSPTLTSPVVPSPGTIPGLILGTAPYLSPEQARGKPVDRRTDIWALGCILYECLTGRLAFRGETVSDTIARVLERDPDWSLLPRHTPAPVRELLRRCLEKDPRKRLRDMGDARIVLEEARSGAAPAVDEGAFPRSRTGLLRTAMLFGVAIVAGAAIAINPWLPLTTWFGAAGPTRGLVHLNLAVPDSLIPLRAQLTPDGQAVVMLANARASGTVVAPVPRIYLRRFDQRIFLPISGTDRGIDFRLSSDGRWIYLVVPISEHATKTVIARVPVDGGGPPTRFCDFDDTWAGWVVLDSGEVVASFGQGRGHVRIAGVSSKPVTIAIPGLTGSCWVVRTLPGDRGVLLGTVSYDGSAYHRGIGVANLRTGKAQVLFTDGWSPHYVSTGHLLFTRWGVLMAAPFDLGRLAVTGDPVAVLGGLKRGPIYSHADIDVASNGTLLSVSGGSFGDRRPVIIDRAGGIVDWSGERQPFDNGVVASPDGGRFASIITNVDGLDEIWVSQRGAPTSRKIVGVAGSDCDSPVWSPDGRRIAFERHAYSNDDGVYAMASDGSDAPRALFHNSSKRELTPLSWFPDGSRILCGARNSGRREIVSIAADPGATPPAEPKAILGGSVQYFDGAFSADGRWVAYTSDQTGNREVFVRAYGPDGQVGDPIQVSVGGGTGEVWRRDGKELAYGKPGNIVMSVQIRAGERLVASTPRKLWDLDSLGVANGMADLLPDGRAVAVLKGPSEGDLTHFDVALNFIDEMRHRLRDRRR